MKWKIVDEHQLVFSVGGGYGTGDSKRTGRSFLGIWPMISKGVGNKWTYDSSDHLMMGLDIIIVLASMMYSLVSDTYKLHPNNKKNFNGFRNRI